jgi:hypothetical protein
MQSEPEKKSRMVANPAKKAMSGFGLILYKCVLLSGQIH